MAKTQFTFYFRRGLTGLLTVAATAMAAADDVEGVVRIRSMNQNPVIRGQSPGEIEQVGHRRRERIEQRRNCPEETVCPPTASSNTYVVEGWCPDDGYMDRSVFCNNSFAHHMRMACMNHRLRNQIASDQLAAEIHQDCHDKFNWFRCKFGYFFPSGAYGKGAPPTGHYSMVYPLNPSYIDPRDTQTYAAPGYGGPVGVPLAPVVHHQYNYGWGVPSSRLTAISNPVLP